MVKSRKAGLWIVSALLVATGIGVLLWRTTSTPPLSIDEMCADSDSLVKQDMKFLNRGRDYAHYEVTVVGASGDTVRGFYRLPANQYKLPALLWVYDAPKAVDPRILLDDIPEISSCAVLCYNVYGFFPHDEGGSLKESSGGLSNGLLRAKHGAELLVQLLKKHHVMDTSRVYIGGEGMGIPTVFAAAAGSTGKLRGIILSEPNAKFSRLPDAEKYPFFNPKSWEKMISPTTLAIASTGSGNAVFASMLPTGWGNETLSAVSTTSPNESEFQKSGLQAAIAWIDAATPRKRDKEQFPSDSVKMIKINK